MELLNAETDLLASFYARTRNLVDSVKTRESLKTKLQQKQEKTELNDKDKKALTMISEECEAKIEEMRQLGIEFVWRGIRYVEVN